MPSLNRVEIIGNVGTPPEMRFTPAGKPVTSFSVAVNSNYGDKETTEWFNVVAWNKTAEFCNQSLEKGQQVYVEGRQQTDTWNDDKGKHYKTQLIASRVILLGKRKQDESKKESDDSPF